METEWIVVISSLLESGGAPAPACCCFLHPSLAIGCLSTPVEQQTSPFLFNTLHYLSTVLIIQLVPSTHRAFRVGRPQFSSSTSRTALPTLKTQLPAAPSPPCWSRPSDPAGPQSSLLSAAQATALELGNTDDCRCARLSSLKHAVYGVWDPTRT